MTNKEYIEQHIKSKNEVIGCYSDEMELFSKRSINRLLEAMSHYEYTDVAVSCKGKNYIVELSLVENERDFVVKTVNEYKRQYGENGGSFN